MAKRYRTGSKNHVMRMALIHAIDDRESMLDGYSNRFYDPSVKPGDQFYESSKNEWINNDPETLEYIQSVKDEIADFKQMLSALAGKP